MSDLTREQKKIKQYQSKENKLLDLTGTTEPRYMCEDCEVEIYLFPQAKVLYYPLQRGPHYICPQCHVITDTSLHKPPGMDEIKPIDMSPPTFSIVPEDKGDSIIVDNKQPFDPEPDEDKWLKNIGATLISKKIESKRDY